MAVRTFALPRGGTGTFARCVGGACFSSLYGLGLALHIVLRSHADDLGRPTGSAGPSELALFHGLPSAWLQHWTPDWSAIEWLAVVMHGSWFLLLAVPLLICATSGTKAAAQVAALELALFYSADAFFAAFPTRPPWMDQHVTRIIVEVYGRNASADDNAVASVPSLHVALPALYAFWLAYQPDRRLKKLAPMFGAWTLLITWAVIYSGEHYVLGATSGAAWAAVVFYAAVFAIPDLRVSLIAKRRADFRPLLGSHAGSLPSRVLAED